MSTAAKPLGARGTAVYIPSDESWKLLAADRGPENDRPVKGLSEKAIAKLGKDNELWVKAFGDDAMVVDGASKVPFDSTVHLKTLPMPGSPAYDALQKMAAKDPLKLARTAYKDGYNGTAIEPTYESSFDGFGKVTGGIKIHNGKITGQAELVIESKFVDELFDKFKAADVPWDKKPTLKVEISGIQSKRGLGVENVRAKISLNGLPPIDLQKFGDMTKLLEQLSTALDANPLDKNVVLEMVKGGLRDMREAWPAFAVKELLDTSEQFKGVIMPVGRDEYEATALNIRGGKGNVSLEIEDVLGKRVGELNLSATAKVAAHDGNANLIRIDEISIGNKGLLSAYVKPNGKDYSAGQIDPKTGKKVTLGSDAAEGVAGLVAILPMLLGQFMPR